MVYFDGYLYDVNGDTVSNSGFYVNDFEAGHSSRQQPCLYNINAEEFGGFKLTGYKVWESIGGGKYKDKFYYDFENKVDIPKDVMTETD